MGFGYQKTDLHVEDYELYFLDGVNFPLRGPRKWSKKQDSSISAIGAAQTFGRFVNKPFTSRLIDDGFNVINFGRSGAGPEFYLKQQEVLDKINETDICFIQVMSARSVTAGEFEAMNNNGVLKFLSGYHKGKTFNAEAAFNLLKKEAGESAVKEQIRQNQMQWVELYKELINKITTKKVLVWIANRKPTENSYKSSIMGGFPHFVNQQMLNAISGDSIDIIYSDSIRTIEQPLFSKFNGKLFTVFDELHFPHRPKHIREVNTYYASQEMHNDIYSKIISSNVLDDIKI